MKSAIVLFAETAVVDAAVDPNGLRLWLVFIAVWVTFWGVAGGIVCHKVKRRGVRGALLGATLAVIGIMLVLLQEDEPKG